MLKIGWFSTGTGPGSRRLLSDFCSRTADKSVDAGISFVFSNRNPNEYEETDKLFKLIHSYNLPLETLSRKNFRTETEESNTHKFDRSAYDSEVLKLISKYDVDVIILAGYMLIVSSVLSNTYHMINLHPALPDGPKGTWREVIKDVIKHQSLSTGTMMHLVTEDVDRGPCVTFSECDLRDLWVAYKAGNLEASDLFNQIRVRQFSQEPVLMFETISSIADGKIDLDELTYLHNGVAMPLPKCLTESVSMHLG